MNKNFSLSTQIVVTEFEKRGYRIKKLPIDKNLISISKSGKSVIMAGSDAPINFALNANFAKKKNYSNYLCKINKIPVPKHIVCTDLKQVKKAAKKIKFPVVVKPVNLAHGEGVIVNIKNIKDLLHESDILLEKYQHIAVEKFIRGRDHRLLIVDGKFISAVMRIPATVTGDGKTNIRQLINIENKNPLRGIGYTKPLVKIEINDETKRLLIKNEYTLEEIPKKGEIIYLKETSNQSKGGETKIVTKNVHQSYIKMAENAAKVIGLKYAGVDIVTEDISKDNYGNLGKIIEVNSFPGIDMHQFPSSGIGDNVGKPIVDMIEKYCFA